MTHTPSAEDKQFLACIEAHPRDWFCLCVYADFLEERGDPLCIGWRLLASERQWPSASTWRDGYRWLLGWIMDGPDQSCRRPAHVLPATMWQYAPFWSAINVSQRYYPSQVPALEDAAVCFAAAQADGWRPLRPRQGT